MHRADILPLAVVTEERVTQEFKNFLSDIEQLLNSARLLTGDSATLARRRIEDKVAQAKVRLEAVRGMAAERFDEHARGAQPWWARPGVRGALAVAATAAIVITVIAVARRSRVA
jgi:ElaB/YqjD/DUF883 family membrane-anchored ribosome-binding protein